MPTTPPLILASASPRRSELLRTAGINFVVNPSPLAEPADRPAHVTPRAWAEALAYFKARSVADNTPGAWTLGADTVVACETALLGKPRDTDDARRMLEAQARTPSDVITGVALVQVDSSGPDGAVPAVRRRLFNDVTRVWMRDAPRLRERYLAGDDWRGKAGAYGIQDIGDELVERIDGSFTNVVGLPMERLTAMLESVAAVSPPPAAPPAGRD